MLRANADIEVWSLKQNAAHCEAADCRCHRHVRSARGVGRTVGRSGRPAGYFLVGSMA